MSNQQWTKDLELRAGIATEYLPGSGTTRVFHLARKKGRIFIIVALGIRDYSAGFWVAIGPSTILDQWERDASRSIYLGENHGND